MVPCEEITEINRPFLEYKSGYELFSSCTHLYNLELEKDSYIVIGQLPKMFSHNLPLINYLKPLTHNRDFMMESLINLFKFFFEKVFMDLTPIR